MSVNDQYDASSITVLEGLEAVRKRPGMYIGSVTTRGLNHLVYEIVDNAVDEHLAGFCSKIHVTLEADGSATVSDNGRGIPVGMHAKGITAERVVLTMLHAGGKFDNNAYKTSGGLHGVGSSVVNALSTRMTVRVKKDGLIYEDAALPEDQSQSSFGSAVTVDEIKGVYRDLDTMNEPELLHLAQAKCYAYILAHQNNLNSIDVQITYCNLDTEEVIRFLDNYSYENLHKWFYELVEQYRRWSDFPLPCCTACRCCRMSWPLPSAES